MKRKIYVISPFSLLEYEKNWKVYYCAELFYLLSCRGYIIHWIQPGRGIRGLSLFPYLSQWRNFIVANVGNKWTYRWMVSFFLSRLEQVSKESKPFLLFEVIDVNPLPLVINESFYSVPIVFSLGKKWTASDNFPGPVIVPSKEVLNDLQKRGVKEKYLKYFPLAILQRDKETKNSEELAGQSDYSISSEELAERLEELILKSVNE